MQTYTCTAQPQTPYTARHIWSPGFSQTAPIPQWPPGIASGATINVQSGYSLPRLHCAEQGTPAPQRHLKAPGDHRFGAAGRGVRLLLPSGCSCGAMLSRGPPRFHGHVSVGEGRPSFPELAFRSRNTPWTTATELKAPLPLPQLGGKATVPAALVLPPVPPNIFLLSGWLPPPTSPAFAPAVPLPGHPHLPSSNAPPQTLLTPSLASFVVFFSGICSSALGHAPYFLYLSQFLMVSSFSQASP